VQYAAVTNGESGIADDAFYTSMDLATLFDAPFFTVKKNGSVKLEKVGKKEWDNLATVFRNRFGMEVINRLDDQDFVSALCKGE
jgi:TPP-dependent pyruvate/acetoin dehydrogenase alpha subunit